MKTKAALYFILLAGIIQAQSAQDAVKRLQSRFNTITNFSAEFSQTFFNSKGEEQGKSAGKFLYKKKNKFVVELKNQSIISDGTNTWNYDKRFKRIVISYLADDPTSFSLEKFIYEYPSLCKIKLVKDNSQGNLSDLIILTPKNNDLQFKEVKIWKNSENLISKMELVDLGEMRYSFSFSDIKTNIDLQEKDFSFTPSKGIKIVDLR